MPGKTLKRGNYKATPGEFYGTPKEIWDFRMPARSGLLAAVARAFLTDHLALFKLEPGLPGMGTPRWSGACAPPTSSSDNATRNAA